MVIRGYCTKELWSEVVCCHKRGMVIWGLVIWGAVIRGFGHMGCGHKGVCTEEGLEMRWLSLRIVNTLNTDARCAHAPENVFNSPPL